MKYLILIPIFLLQWSCADETLSENHRSEAKKTESQDAVPEIKVKKDENSANIEYVVEDVADDTDDEEATFLSFPLAGNWQAIHDDETIQFDISSDTEASLVRIDAENSEIVFPPISLAKEVSESGAIVMKLGFNNDEGEVAVYDLTFIDEKHFELIYRECLNSAFANQCANHKAYFGGEETAISYSKE